MIRYVGKRLIQLIPVLLAVALLIFTLMYFVPGDPARIILGDNATPVEVERVRNELGLNDPYFTQLGRFFKGLVRLDFGKSYFSGLDVGKELKTRFPYTLRVALLCISFTVCVGVPIGISSALKANKLPDRVWMFITMLSSSMPNFWLALLLVLLLTVKLDLLPPSGVGGIEYYIIPVLANSIGSLAGISRQTRSSMLEVIRADYIYTAKSKGVSRREVVWKHALPNALIPIITSIGASFGMMMGGSTITETIFSIPGIGLYMVNGIGNRDYPVVRGCILYIAFIFSVMMLITDIVYAFVDPRIKAQYVRGKRKTESKNSTAGGISEWQ